WCGSAVWSRSSSSAQITLHRRIVVRTPPAAAPTPPPGGRPVTTAPSTSPDPDRGDPGRSDAAAAGLAAYVEVMHRLLARGGFERPGNAAGAKRWAIDHIANCREAHGRPDRRNTVHVAGSKANGSVATITEAILREAIREAGGHTLLITSPDLHSA